MTEGLAAFFQALCLHRCVVCDVAALAPMLEIFHGTILWNVVKMGGSQNDNRAGDWMRFAILGPATRIGGASFQRFPDRFRTAGTISDFQFFG